MLLMLKKILPDNPDKNLDMDGLLMHMDQQYQAKFGKRTSSETSNQESESEIKTFEKDSS